MKYKPNLQYDSDIATAVAVKLKWLNSRIAIIFQTVCHFASASGLKFSHDDHNKDNDWILNLNEISISNTNQTTCVMTNRIWCVSSTVL